MTQPTDAEKAAEKAASDARRADAKSLFKEAMTEFLTENQSRQRTTGQPVEDGNSKKSVFEQLFGL